MYSFTFLTKNAKRGLIIACLAWLLVGCPSLPDSKISDDYATASSYYYMDQANNSYGAEKINWQLLTTRALMRENDLIKAEEYLNTIPVDDLTEKQQTEYTLVTAELQIAQRKPSHALTSLNKLMPDQLAKVQQIRYYQTQIKAAPRNNVLMPLRAYVLLEQLVPDDQKQTVINEAWSALTKIKTRTLNSLAIQADEVTLMGWLDLARLYQTYYKDVGKLKDEIKSWQIRYANNPMAQLLPAQLANILQYEPLNIKDVALLLPLEGPAEIHAKAIMAGFKAGMEKDNAASIQFQVYNTANRSIPDLLQQIQKEGYSMVVGPLLKTGVQEAINTSTSLNMLVLNTPDSVINKNNVCYFGLIPEDEARQAAQYIQRQRKQMPLIIAPQGAFGERWAKAFDLEWEQLGGRGTLVQYFHSLDDLKEAMNTNNGIKLIGEPVIAGQMVANLPIDAAYIVSNHDELVVIKAMLDMASQTNKNVTYYASSRSNQADTDPDFRLEMEGLRFSDIPLLAGANSRIYRQAMKTFENDYDQIRLYAMGMDAWALANHFAQLRQLHNFQMNGMTGKLQSDQSCLIGRKLTWLTYEQGRLILAK